MIEIKGLKKGKIELWNNDKRIKQFIKSNDALLPYLERMYENFEVTSYDFKDKNPTVVLDENGYAHCLDPLRKDFFGYIGWNEVNSIIIHDIGISDEYEEYNNDNSYFIYELSAELNGLIISSLIDKYGKIYYWNPDWNSIDPNVIKSHFIKGD